MKQNVFFHASRSLFEWTKVIQNGELKVAVDYVLCSICQQRPEIFDALMTSLMEKPGSILDDRSL